jgi:hypothetical protein
MTDSLISHRTVTVPLPATWLGGLGVLPFAGLAGAAALDLVPEAYLVTPLLAYGAVILSFLGGVRWGTAMLLDSPAQPPEILARRLGISIAPSLIAWVALLIASTAALPVLIGAFAAMLAVDLSNDGRDGLPTWYPRLRSILTGAVIGCLIVAWIAL